MALHRAGRLTEADEQYAAVLGAMPDHPQALRLRGILARDTGNLARSVKLLRKAVDAADADPEPAAELGLSYLASGYLQLAEMAFRKALARDPESRKALANLGTLLQYRGHIHGAIECHRQCLALDPDDLDVRCNLANTLAEAGRGDEALAECDVALAAAPGRPELLATRGAVLCALERYADAAPVLEAALATGPDDMALSNLGMARQQLGQHAAAIAALDTAVRVNRDNARATADLTTLLSEAGRSDAALELSAGFLARHPAEGLVLAARGAALRDAGHAVEARQLVDLEGLVRLRKLPVPKGFADLREFNRRLAALIHADPSLIASPRGKATRSGAQTGEFNPDSDPVLAALRDAFNRELRGAIAELNAAGFGAHPAMAWATDRWTLRIWATVLGPGGHQTPHLHPLGWLSGVYYVQAPAGMCGDDGALEFGVPPERVLVREAPDRRRIEAQEGRLVIFPSYFWHRTLPFTAPGDRISIAFDVMPARSYGLPGP